MYVGGMRFSEHFLRDRAEWADRQGITLGLCECVVSEPVERDRQPEDGRTVYWGYVPEVDRYLRVVVEPDGEEIVTAHFDRGFKRKVRRSEE